MDKYDKWKNEYINNVDVDYIEWIKLSSNELRDFIYNNYLDKEEWEYVLNEKNDSVFPTLLGMHYLNLLSHETYYGRFKYLLGIVDNNIGKKTIVGDIAYLDNYKIFTTQAFPATFISYVEINNYFQNMGLFKKMCEAFFENINQNQHIITTVESDYGKRLKALETFRKIMYGKGFNKEIIENRHDYATNERLYDILVNNKSNGKILK